MYLDCSNDHHKKDLKTGCSYGKENYFVKFLWNFKEESKLNLPIGLHGRIFVYQKKKKD